MTFHEKIALEGGIDPHVDLLPVQYFLSEHAAALATAANLLGGPAASGRLFMLVEALRDARRLSRTHRRQLVALHELLSLKHVGEPDRIETGRFAAIDPGAPIVEEICLLADALEQLLRRIAGAAAFEEPGPAGVNHLAKVA